MPIFGLVLLPDKLPLLYLSLLLELLLHLLLELLVVVPFVVLADCLALHWKLVVLLLNMVSGAEQVKAKLKLLLVPLQADLVVPAVGWLVLRLVPH